MRWHQVEFLELSDAEEMLVNMKLALAVNVKTLRQQEGITQQELAKRIGSSQSRIAKMEIADGSVSMELFVRSLACGTRRITHANRQDRRHARCGAKTRNTAQKTTCQSVSRSTNGRDSHRRSSLSEAALPQQVLYLFGSS